MEAVCLLGRLLAQESSGEGEQGQKLWREWVSRGCGRGELMIGGKEEGRGWSGIQWGVQEGIRVVSQNMGPWGLEGGWDQLTGLVDSCPHIIFLQDCQVDCGSKERIDRRLSKQCRCQGYLSQGYLADAKVT